MSWLEDFRKNNKDRPTPAGKKPYKPPPKPKPSPAAKQGQAPFGTEDVVCSCGHKTAMALFAKDKPEYVVKRRQNIMARPCPECRTIAHNAKMAKEQEEAKARREAKLQERNRLPHGSEFEVVYDAVSLSWSGQLTIYRERNNGGNVTFAGVASGVFRLLRELDEQYRNWVKSEKRRKETVDEKSG